MSTLWISVILGLWSLSFFRFLFLRADSWLGRISSLAYYLCYLLIFVCYCFFVYYLNAVLSPVTWRASKGCLQGKVFWSSCLNLGPAYLKSPAVDLLTPDFLAVCASPTHNFWWCMSYYDFRRPPLSAVLLRSGGNLYCHSSGSHPGSSLLVKTTFLSL